MAVLIDEILGEMVGAALEDKFPSIKDTTPESEAIESPSPAMAGVGGGSALAIALREIIKRSKGASGGDEAAKNIASRVASATGTEDRLDDLIELSKRAMASEEAADLLSETLETRLNPKDFDVAKNTPKGRDVQGMQDFLLEQSQKEAGTAKRSAAKKSSRFQELGEELSREAELDPDLPPPSKTSGTSAATDAIPERGASTASGGPLDTDTGRRGQTLGAGKSARKATEDIVDADIIKPGEIGFDDNAFKRAGGAEGFESRNKAKGPGRGFAEKMDEFSKNKDFRKTAEKSGEGIFGADFIKKIPKKYKWLAGIGAVLGAWKLATDPAEQPKAPVEDVLPRDTESMLAASEESLDIATGTGRAERDRKNLKRRQALEIMNRELAKEFGSK